MSRLLRSAAAGVLTAVLCVGTSTGPVRADDQAPTGTTTAAPSPTQTISTETIPTETTPAEKTPPESTPTNPASASTPTTTTPTTAEPPPSAAPAADLADLQLRVWFEKPSYRSDEAIYVHATVTNAGAATARHVVVSSTGNLGTYWRAPGYTSEVIIEPGHTVEWISDGTLLTEEETVHLVATVRQTGGEPEANPDDNTVTASVPVVILRGSLRATIYGDRDGDQVMDPGEALAGISVHISGGSPHTERTAATDANGVVIFGNLPVGHYGTVVNWRGSGWYVPSGGGTVSDVDDADVLLRATPELSNDRLKTSLAFTQTSYRRGDTPLATLRLHNTSTLLLTDLTADCGSADEGELTPGGPGVVLRPGEKRDFTVTMAPITDGVASTGHVRLHCTVSAAGSGLGSGITALARVPGDVAPRVTGALIRVRVHSPIRPPLGDPVPNVKVYLRDAISNAIVVRAVTDTNGRFTFYDVPAGLYNSGAVGPWQPFGGTEFVVQSGEDGSTSHLIYVVPGTDQPDPDAAPPGDTPPGGGPPPNAAPPSGTPHLAATGTGAARLALSGLLTLLAGTGLVLIARRGPNGPGSRRT